MTEIRQGSAPNFAPPVQEGAVFGFEDENGAVLECEFLGLIIHNERRYGFFFPIDDSVEIGASGTVVILEVVALDEEGQPSEFELVTDEAIAEEVYNDFREATKDIYRFA